MKKFIQTIKGFFAKANVMLSLFLAKFRKPKLEVTLKHIITYSDGTKKELSEEEAYKETGCRVTIKQVK